MLLMFSLSLALALLKIQLEIQLDDTLCYWSKYGFIIGLLIYFCFAFPCQNSEII